MSGIGNWLAVASAEHVRIGRSQGFMQVNHGKAAPLRRVKPGDRVVYYSATEVFRAADGFQSFTAIGIVADREPYQGVMGNGFKPFRRDVLWLPAHEAPIRPLLPDLHFATQGANWGYKLRFGLFELDEHDIQLIAAAMECVLTAS
ncbi:MAG: EVE domain-containing protein [Rhizobiales bacterium]|nr:EVE domain-containing protein [Hyphomicrobiales bacterium]